ncbi:MAG: GntR family transcriptional regulator [Candidatus Aminicenantes bacterium]|nr:MAG: GntR family transcriptional regulator [Candidatus Aminicenantes bacterium]
MNDKKAKRKLFNIEFKEPETLRERIYFHLREAIIHGYITAGERIVEKKIAQEFNVSITPAREAILQLSMEGFVEIKTHKNIIVSQISLKEMGEIYEVQAVLEGVAGRLAAPELSEEHLSKMEKLIEDMIKHFKSNNVDKFYEANEKMHEIYLKRSGNELVNDLISKLNLRKKMFRYRVTFLAKRDVMKKAIEDHKKILKGFLSRDPEEVEKLIRDHWKSDTRIKDFEIAMQNDLAHKDQ